MGFWIFMLAMDLLIPLTMIVCGWVFVNKTPQNINWIYGYRTAMSMKNKETWNFAHKHCGRIWYRVGLFMLPVSFLVILIFIRSDVDMVGTAGGILCGAQAFFLLLSIIPTEMALKKTFNKDGSYRI